EADLRRAIQREAFEPHFQPIVRLSDGVVVGHEALLRWKHELHGWLPPSEFLRVCEDSGLIEQVDWQLYRRVVGWMARNLDGYVSNNDSLRDCHPESLTEDLRRTAAEACVDHRRLGIEIT